MIVIPLPASFIITNQFYQIVDNATKNQNLRMELALEKELGQQVALTLSQLATP